MAPVDSKYEFAQEHLMAQQDEMPPTANDDDSFLARVFSQVRDVDFRAPPPPAPKGLAGPDKKMFDLREKVRRLERDLARLGSIWTSKQQAMNNVDAIIGAKEAERVSAVDRYNALQDQVARNGLQQKLKIEELQRQLAERDETIRKLQSGEAD